MFNGFKKSAGEMFASHVLNLAEKNGSVKYIIALIRTLV